MENQIYDADFFRALKRMQLLHRLNVQSGAVGLKKSNAKGSSVEFSDFREYMLGDDLRKIDWNAYGRMDKLFVKLFREERELNYTILLDTSKSMDFGEMPKWDRARQAAAGIAYIALNHQDRVRAGCLSTKNPVCHKTVTGRQGFWQIASQIEKMSLEGETVLSESVKRMPFHGAGVTVVISDFFAQNTTAEKFEDIKELMRFLSYNRQEVILVQVLSGEEKKPDFEGTVSLVDSETEENLQVTMGSKLVKEYKRALRSYKEQLKNTAKAYQGVFLETNSTEPFDKFLFDGIHQGVFGV